MTTLRPARPEDADAWTALRVALWPDGTADEHRAEVDAYVRGERPRGPQEVLVVEDDAGEQLGFAEVSIRPYAEGCATARVAYLEGWFVRADARRAGLGRRLVAAAEDWGRAQGCTEFASDVDPENATSLAAHEALGFEDAGLVRCLRKDLRRTGSEPE